MINSDIAERILKIREILFKSQTAMAEHFGVSQKTVSNWETGRNDPPYSVLLELYKEYDVSLLWLMAGDGAMFNSETKVMNDSQKTSPDSELLADILTGIDNFLDSYSKTLENKYKAQLAATLYTHFAAEYEKELKGGKVVSFKEYKQSQDIDKSVALMMLGVENG